MRSRDATYTPQELLNDKIIKDYKGLFICHICGKSYNSICAHLSSTHNMTIEEYCEKFNAKKWKKRYKATATPLNKEEFMNKMTNIHRGIKASKATKILRKKIKGGKNCL